jgi:N-6 DNA Methylase
MEVTREVASFDRLESESHGRPDRLPWPYSGCDKNVKLIGSIEFSPTITSANASIQNELSCRISPFSRFSTENSQEKSDAELAKIAGTYHAWRGDAGAGEYADVPGFCNAASIDDIRKHRYVLTPGPYVGAEAAEEAREHIGLQNPVCLLPRGTLARVHFRPSRVLRRGRDATRPFDFTP